MPTSVAGQGVCSRLGTWNPPTEHEAQLSRAARDGSRWDPVNDFLVTCLDSIDERFLEYLDAHGEVRVSTVQRLRFFARAMLDGSMRSRQVADEWADFFVLTPAFVAAHGTWELADLESDARLLHNGGVEDNPRLTEADRVYLIALEVALDSYPEVRTTQ